MVAEHDLVPAGPVNLRTEEIPNAEEVEVLQEQGEESADEHDPIVEFVPEPDAETEPRASHDGLPLAELSHSATSQVTASKPQRLPHVQLLQITRWPPLRLMALGMLSQSESNIQLSMTPLIDLWRKL